MTTLSERVRTGTRQQHMEAESAGFIVGLMAGSLTKDHYVLLLRQYLEIYRALESSCRQLRSQGELLDILDPHLERESFMRADLESLGGTELPVLAETLVYADRVRRTSTNGPALLAHHYTRYLGDLSGGQVVARKVQDHYGLTDDQVRTWRFATVSKLKPYKDSYRARLDALGWNSQQEEAFLAEVRHAFDLNTALFRALQDATTPHNQLGHFNTLEHLGT